MLIAAAIVLGALITTVKDDNGSSIPDDFNLTESRQIVTQAMPGSCTNTRNSSLENVYYFECTQEHGNYTYVGEARVVYNETGPDRVIVFD